MSSLINQKKKIRKENKIMTKKLYRTETYDKEHIHFGGKIYPSDFNTNYSGKNNTNGSTIAARIVSDFRYEKYLLTQTSHINLSYVP